MSRGNGSNNKGVENMEKLAYTLNREQLNTLEGLAHWHADKQYLLERYGREEARHEIEQAHQSIISLFASLDRLGVPYWLQNVVLAFSEDWRRYKARYLSSYLEGLTAYNVRIDWRA